MNRFYYCLFRSSVIIPLSPSLRVRAQVTGLTQSLGESAAKMGEDLQQTVNSLAAFDLEVEFVGEALMIIFTFSVYVL